MANECATTNCEDKSGKDDFAYCGQSNCSSCGGGCGDDNCSKCNRRPKWGSKKASTDRAFSTGWSIIKQRLTLCDECSTAVYDAMSSHMDPFADEQPDFEEIAATMGADLPDHRCESREEAEEWQRMELKCLCACNGR